MGAPILNVQKLFYEEYIKVTEQLSHIKMVSSENFDKKEDDFAGIVKIKENTYYDLALVCSISYPIAQQIAKEMSRGTVSTKEEIVIYMTEYLNIASGRAITQINNFFGKSVRFSVPIIDKLQYNKEDFENYIEKFKIYFKSDFGKILLEVGYTIKDKTISSSKVN